MRRRFLVLTACAAGLALAFGWSPASRWWRAGKMLVALSSAHAATPDASAGRQPPQPLIEENVNVAGAA